MSSPTSAPDSAACPRCHRPIPAAAPLGACPHCLLAAGLPTAVGPTPSDEAPSPAPADLAPEFPALDILELLGRGGMGAVYKARQRDLDRLVALKILRPGLDADPGFAERFTREARSLAKLNHPGIVTLYEFGRTPTGRYFILMEFVDGMNLRGLLDAGRLAPREALAIVPPLCDALQYAHDRGLVHRDIKPENILIDRLGRVKIADFGIAKLTKPAPGPLSTPGAAAPVVHWPLDIGLSAADGGGTPAYMAPEQRQNPAAVDHRADLYALGVVLYQMLTGELPAPGQLQPPSHRVQIDVRLDEIVLRALEKDPALRYAAAREFKTHVETVTSTPAPASTPANSSELSPSEPSIAAPSASSPAAAHPHRYYGFSYRSRRTLFGLPLLHVATGLDPVTGRRQVARGVVAIGDIAQGFIALGGVAMGGFTFGGISLGVFSYGGLVLALFAVGGLGVGGLAAFAGLAIAPIALGGFALGWYAFGGSAIGAYVSASGRHDPEAIAFFGPWAREFTQIAGIATLAAMGLGFAVMFSAIELARKRAMTAASGTAAPPPAPNTRRPFPPSLICLLIFGGMIAILLPTVPLLTRAARSQPRATTQQLSWNLDVVVTDHRAWPPKTLPSDRALPVAGAALALLGACDTRQPATSDDWRAAEASPHLRFAYPRAAEGKMPDVILVPLPLGPDDALWTRKGEKITRHTTFSPVNAEALTGFLDTSPLVVVLLADGMPRIDGAPVSTEALHDAVADHHRRSPASGVEIRPATSTSSASLASVLNICKTIGSRVKVAPAVAAINLPPVEDALAWLQKIDRGDYAGSWHESGASFKASLSQPDWVKALLAVRAPLGEIQERRLDTSRPATELPGVPDGEHLVMTFATRFTHKAAAVEILTFSRQADGSWRATGYFIR